MLMMIITRKVLMRSLVVGYVFSVLNELSFLVITYSNPVFKYD